MKYAVIFALLAAVLIVEAIQIGNLEGALLLWPALSLVTASIAYAGIIPALFGKQADGSIAAFALALLMPLLLLTWGVWHLQRRWTRTPPRSEIAPGIWLGRRPLAHELPPETALVVDMTAEFPAAPGITRSRDYIALPTLDATAPREADLREVTAIVVAHRGPVYLHCALGQGRSALLAAAVLLARGLAHNANDAWEQVKARRPGAKLSRSQWALLERFAADPRLTLPDPPLSPDSSVADISHPSL